MIDYTELRELLLSDVECLGHEPDPEHDEQGRTVYCDGSCRHTPSPLNRHARMLVAVLEMGRRDWVREVLDAWPRPDGSGPARWYVKNPKGVVLNEYGTRPRHFESLLAAAETVWPELPESERARLGEKP